MLDLFLKRIREPSTWAGLAAVGVAFGLDPALVGAVGQVVVGGCGVAAILLAERK